MNTLPVETVYPEEHWEELPLQEAGFTPELVAELERLEPQPYRLWDEPVTQCASLITRDGRLVWYWGDTRHYRHQTASVGKAFTIALLGLAVEKLGLNPDEPVYRTWTGAGQMSHEHKRMDSALHRDITWRHLKDHTAGFAMETAWWWRHGIGIPNWVNQEEVTGNPMYDMRSFRAPGTASYYSSAHYVRLGQALTALWGTDLKRLLDEEIFSVIGITPDRWDWMSLCDVYQNIYLYPDTPGYGHFADPPYEIEGNIVRGGPGWVSLSAEDLARWGLLVATQGVWKGRQLLAPEWVVSHGSGNRSAVIGIPEACIAIATITAEGLPPFLWEVEKADQIKSFLVSERI